MCICLLRHRRLSGLPTHVGRVRVPLQATDRQAQLLAGLGATVKQGAAKLHEKRGRWYLALRLRPGDAVRRDEGGRSGSGPDEFGGSQLRRRNVVLQWRPNRLRPPQVQRVAPSHGQGQSSRRYPPHEGQGSPLDEEPGSRDQPQGRGLVHRSRRRHDSHGGSDRHPDAR